MNKRKIYFSSEKSNNFISFPMLNPPKQIEISEVDEQTTPPINNSRQKIKTEKKGRQKSQQKLFSQ